MLDDGYLWHNSGKCVKPTGRVVDGVELALYDNCHGHKFGFTKGGSIKHLGSGKCIQPTAEVNIKHFFIEYESEKLQELNKLWRS